MQREHRHPRNTTIVSHYRPLPTELSPALRKSQRLGPSGVVLIPICSLSEKRSQTEKPRLSNGTNTGACLRATALLTAPNLVVS